MIDREWLARAIAAPTGDRLINAPVAEPLPGQVRILEQAIAAVRRAGVQLPAFDVHWREGAAGVCGGVACRFVDGTYAMYLSASAWPEDLRRTVFHELRHLADLDSGRSFSRVDLEERAVDFANTMMLGLPIAPESASALEDQDERAARPRARHAAARPELPYTVPLQPWTRGRVLDQAARAGFPHVEIRRFDWNGTVKGSRQWRDAIRTWPTREVNRLLQQLLREEALRVSRESSTVDSPSVSSPTAGAATCDHQGSRLARAGRDRHPHAGTASRLCIAR